MAPIIPLHAHVGEYMSLHIHQARKRLCCCNSLIRIQSLKIQPGLSSQVDWVEWLRTLCERHCAESFSCLIGYILGMRSNGVSQHFIFLFYTTSTFRIIFSPSSDSFPFILVLLSDAHSLKVGYYAKFTSSVIHDHDVCPWTGSELPRN